MRPRPHEAVTALDTRLATARSSSAASATTGGSVGIDRHGHRSRFDARQAGERGRDDIVDGDRRPPGREHAGFEAAHVEQVPDDPIEPIGLVVDGVEELGALRGRPLDVVGQAAPTPTP